MSRTLSRALILESQARGWDPTKIVGITDGYPTDQSDQSLIPGTPPVLERPVPGISAPPEMTQSKPIAIRGATNPNEGEPL